MQYLLKQQSILELGRLMLRPASQIFRITRIFLNDECLLTQGARARNEDRKPVSPHHPTAVQWSVNGALALSSNDRGITPYCLLTLLDRVSEDMGLLNYTTDDYGTTLRENFDDIADYLAHGTLMEVLDGAYAVAVRIEHDSQQR